MSDGCDPEFLSSTVVTEELKSSLARALGLFRDAAESFSKVRPPFCFVLFSLFLSPLTRLVEELLNFSHTHIF